MVKMCLPKPTWQCQALSLVGLELALGLGLWTMLYGFVLYCCTIVISLASIDVKLQSFTSQNWHLVEVYTFFVFLVLGPPTLMELFASG